MNIVIESQSVISLDFDTPIYNLIICSIKMLYEYMNKHKTILKENLKGSLTVWALYAYFSDSQNAAF